MAHSRSADKPTVQSELTLLFNADQPYKKFKITTHKDLVPTIAEVTEKKMQGTLIGVAVGDALGAPVEFRPNAYLKQNEVKDMLSGGTWGLQAGQWTDDTSMTLCLAASLIVQGKFDTYDQFVRYRRWYREGYMSSTGKCFDIGKATRDAITEFERFYQQVESKPSPDPFEQRMKEEIQKRPNALRFGPSDAAGNGPLMRLAPIPCFFFGLYDSVKEHIAEATELTHGNQKAVDSCQFYAGLIWHALHGTSKTKLLDKHFYTNVLHLKLCPEVRDVAEGSYKDKKRGYEDGIRGKGYIVNALEAALWAFDNDDEKFEIGVLKAVNLGDDTDTTAAIYGALAGAVYGVDAIPEKWRKQLAQREFIEFVGKALYFVGNQSNNKQAASNWQDNSDDKDYGGDTYVNRHNGEQQKKDETRNQSKPNLKENRNGKQKEENISDKPQSASSTRAKDASNGSNASANAEPHSPSPNASTSSKVISERL